MSFLTKDQIVKADDKRTEVVKVPEWDGEVMVKAWTAQEKADFEINYTSIKGKERLRTVREKVVVASVIDPKTKKLLFTYDDVAMLSKKSGAAMDRIYDASSKMNGISDSDAKELAKN